MQVATMIKLDERGRITDTRLVEWQGCQWKVLVESGWITRTVDKVPAELIGAYRRCLCGPMN